MHCGQLDPNDGVDSVTPLLSDNHAVRPQGLNGYQIPNLRVQISDLSFHTPAY